MTPTAAEITRAVQALGLQLEITRGLGSMVWGEADWMLDAHGDTILAALREREQALAASQAECAALREALQRGRECGNRLCGSCEEAADAALSRPPGSREALRALLLRIANDGWSAGFGVASMIRDGHSWYSTQENECASLVARVLDRSDTTEGGRG